MIKGLFKESHPIVQLLMLLAVAIIGAMFASIVWVFVDFVKNGFSMENVGSFMNNLMDNPARLREMQFFSALGTFIFPAILLAYLFSDNYKDYLYLDTPFDLSLTLLTIVSMLVAFPLWNFLAYYNQQMAFPESLKFLEDIMRSQEEQNGQMMEMMLYAENTWALVFNIVIIAIFAAVGEEFIFRGVLQNIIEKFKINYHLVIWIAAIIFSAVHFQFYGFIPRMLMGAYFGYILYFTKNMWMPVLAHFTNNFTIVILSYIYQDQPEVLEATDAIGIGDTAWMAVVSLILLIGCFILIRKKSKLQLQGFTP